MAPQQNGPLINPTICVGITAFIIGTAIGIGFGVLIANNKYRNGIGGGIWFGRKKRSLTIDDDGGLDLEKENEILTALDKTGQLYGEED